MATRFARVSTFEAGEIDKRFRNNVEAPQRLNGVEQMLNWLPDTAGDARRRFSTVPIGDPRAEFGADVRYIPFRYSGDDGIDILVVDPSGASVTYYQWRTDTGAVSSLGSFAIGPGDMTDYAVAGESIFITWENDFPHRIIVPDVRAGSFTVETPNTSPPLRWYKELPGFFSADASDAAVDDRLVPTVRAVDTNSETQLLDRDGVSPGETVVDQKFVTDANLSDLSSQGIITTGGSGTLFLVGDQVFQLTTVGALNSDESIATAPFTDSFSDSRVHANYPVTEVKFHAPAAQAVGFFQGRLVFAGFAGGLFGLPTRVVMSKLNNPFIIFPGQVLDDSPIDIDVFLDENERFTWVMGTQKRLFIGSPAGVVALATEGITPANAAFNNFLKIGSADVKPVLDTERLIYVAKNNGGVFAAQFNETLDSFQAVDLTFFVHHIARDMDSIHFHSAVESDSLRRVYVRKTDGTLLVGSVLGELPAWATIELAEDLTVDAVVALGDEMYLIVRDGNEILLTEFLFSDGVEDVVDLLQVKSGTFDTTCSFLFNKKVWARVDGVARVAQVDGAGELQDLDGNPITGGVAIYGLVFPSRMKLFDPVIQDEKGGSTMRITSNVTLTIDVLATRQLRVNQELALPDVPLTSTEDKPLRDGAFEITQFGWEREDPVLIEGELGYNATVLGYVFEVGT